MTSYICIMRELHCICSQTRSPPPVHFLSAVDFLEGTVKTWLLGHAAPVLLLACVMCYRPWHRVTTQLHTLPARLGPSFSAERWCFPSWLCTGKRKTPYGFPISSLLLSSYRIGNISVYLKGGGDVLHKCNFIRREKREMAVNKKHSCWSTVDIWTSKEVLSSPF